MNSKLEADKSLFYSRWKSTPDVYLQPETHCRGPRVPSLVWFCLQCISESPDQIQLPYKLIYRPPKSLPPKSFRLIDKLLRAAPARNNYYMRSVDDLEPDLRKLDPRLWATIIQIFDQIPTELRNYTLALNDNLLPLIQGIKNTDTFSLLTILELPGCDALTDDSITGLRGLHTLTALDASNTRLSSRGIVALARTLRVNDPEESARALNGPWGLRVLRLKHCAGIDDTVYQVLSSFPLLTVVDLRGTKCRPPTTPNKSSFSASKERRMFSSDLASSLEVLQKHQQDIRMFSAPRQYCFTLRIKNLCHEQIASALTERYEKQGDSTHQYYDDISHDRNDQGDENDEESLSEEDQGEEEISWRRNESPEGFWYQEYEYDEKLVGDSHSRIKGKKQSLRQLRKTPTPLDNNPWRLKEPSQRGFLPSETRPLKRFKRPSAAGRDPQESSPEGCFPRTVEMSSDSETDEQTVGHPMNILPRRGLHWYDADHQRATAYVPLSVTRGNYDDDLMLYRPMRPWHLLGKELDELLEKEARLAENARVNGTNAAPVDIAPGNRNMLKAQVGLHAMTALAVRRRQKETIQPQSESTQAVSLNPPPTQTAQPIEINPFNRKVQKPLRPISALRVPTFTQELIEKSTRMAQDLDSHETTPTAPTPRQAKDRDIIAKSISQWGPPSTIISRAATMTSTERGKEQQKRRDVWPPESISSTSSPASLNKTTSTVAPLRPKKSQGKGKGKKAEESRFDWEAWATKKTI
ncbi:hypothetical protein D9756_001580 [Leucocoprinus leucothites]|uniref:Uncharacterized protein n=1 Tax=Leucocoprinus leucothites TaxID=201217 RepID=A0A8H5LHR2_9AGAR|nr:hypothetical protein D9756_001580 [Leucoagaricus leucothites]